MIRRIVGIGAVTLMGMLILGVVAVSALSPGGEASADPREDANAQVTATSGTAGSMVMAQDGPMTDLSESEIEALRMALDDEYKAWSVYDQVITDFGQVRPFTNIRKAEENHIVALVTLFQRYGVDVPANDWPGKVPTFGTVAEACEAGVQAEIDNAALYDQLFGMVDNPDIVQVFTALQQASQTKHLPAFERCASGPTPGRDSTFLPQVSR